MYNTLPKSLKSEVFVASRVIDDPELIAQRQEMVRSKTPRQLAQMSTLDDFPIPTRIENLVKKSKNMSESMQKRWDFLALFFALVAVNSWCSF